ncbi:MAG: hypothetical protein PHI64_12900 [Zoogloea sp.]|uniref:hypothetical protein n=1 Tax=Zoogloea sp. TaxID=49181 RepID=UPI002632D65C|nr:hypothetical protein [Zoogloea sp.]MDD2989847.1 hypothetical protein [Zoogloea sp.]
MILWNDAETFSELDLKAVGTYIYANHPSTELLMVSWALGDGPVQLWVPAEGEPMPPALLAAYLDGSIIKAAHNAAFDRNVIPRCLERMGLITREQRLALVNPDRWVCTMALALAHALPPDLDTLGRVLGLGEDEAKIAEGSKLIQRFCKPAPMSHKARRYDHHSHPEHWARFKRYAEVDVVAMRACQKRTPAWNWHPQEVALWRLDQRINDRGFYADKALVDAAVRAVDEEKEVLATRFRVLTHGRVEKPTQREQFKAFLAAEHGLVLENTQAETLRSARGKAPDGSPLAELLDIAIASNKTSTSKYARVQVAIAADGRVRGTIQYSAAGRTRRWGGRLFQPQNLPSRGLPKATLVDIYIQAVKLGLHTWLFSDLMRFGSAALRGVVTAPPGRHICAADLSNIEGRMLSWVAGEEWKLLAFRAYDTGTGPDLYNVTANMIIGVDPWNVPKKVRNVFGKVPDLASGYQGGVAGYQNFARVYGVKMADHWDTIQKSVPPEIITKARHNLAKPWARQQLQDLEISEVEWLASEACKLAWRAKHPATVSFWYAIEKAAKAAIKLPGSVHTVTRLTVTCTAHEGHRWLQILLPSGSRLCYFDPGLTEDGSLFYWGMASDEGSGGARVWTRCYTHGGKLTGNICQTLARDVLAYAMPPIERAGYDIVLTVHDEVVAEAPESLDEGPMVRILATNPPWASGLPLAAAGFSAPRYAKED